MDRHLRYADEAVKKKSARQAEAAGEANSEKKSKGGQNSKRAGNSAQNDETTTANLTLKTIDAKSMITSNVAGVELLNNVFAPGVAGGSGKYPRIIPGPVSIVAGVRTSSALTDDAQVDQSTNVEQVTRVGDDAIAVVAPKAPAKGAEKATSKRSANTKGPASATSNHALDAPLMRLGASAPSSRMSRLCRNKRPMVV